MDFTASGMHLEYFCFILSNNNFINSSLLSLLYVFVFAKNIKILSVYIYSQTWVKDDLWIMTDTRTTVFWYTNIEWKVRNQTIFWAKPAVHNMPIISCLYDSFRLDIELSVHFNIYLWCRVYINKILQYNDSVYLSQ